MTSNSNYNSNSSSNTNINSDMHSGNRDGADSALMQFLQSESLRINNIDYEIEKQLPSNKNRNNLSLDIPLFTSATDDMMYQNNNNNNDNNKTNENNDANNTFNTTSGNISNTKGNTPSQHSSMSSPFVQTPTLKIDQCDTFVNDFLLNSNTNLQNTTTNNNLIDNNQYLTPTNNSFNINSNANNNNNVSNGYLSDYDNNNTNSNINNNNNNSEYHTPYLSPQDHFSDRSRSNSNGNINTGTITNINLAVSPSTSTSSYLLRPISTNEYDNNSNDIDDTGSIYSNSSNMLLPVNSRGLKHINDIDDLDLLLDNIGININDLPSDGITTTTTTNNNNIHISNESTPASNFSNNTNSNFNSNINYTAPIISIQEVNEFNNTTTTMSPTDNNFNLFNLDSPMIENQINEFSLSSNNNIVNTNNLNLSPSVKYNNTTSESEDDHLIHENIINGRKLRRKSIVKSRSRSRSRRGSSISLDEKARSLSENRDKLLELADLKIENNDNNDNKSNTNASAEKKIPSQSITLKSSTGGFLSSQIFTTNKINDNTSLTNIKDSNNKSETSETESNLNRKNPAIYACELCDKKFTRPYNLKSHLRTHTNERPFICSICDKAFARQHDRKRHEDLHSGKKRYVCGGKLKNGQPWGCGKKFARSDALGRHFKTESGKKCIAPLYEEAEREKKQDPTTVN